MTTILSTSTIESLLSIKQASEFLDVEENRLLELLHCGTIAALETDGELSVVAESLLQYKTEMKKRQKKALEEMAAENQRLGLYD